MANDRPFCSSIGGYIQSFINVKRALGFQYKEHARCLYHFDRMVAESFPGAETVTKEICRAWIELKPDQTTSGLTRRLTPVRKLSKYINGLGIPAYVIPGNIPGKVPKYEAHIYTAAELQAFFHAIDQCEYCPWSPTQCYIVPIFFRLLYCCGLRSSEARCLQRNDVDLDTGKIMIRESKGRRKRIIFMSNDMLILCREYDAIIERILPGREAFLPNRNGTHYGKSRTNDWFHKFWASLPEAKAVKGNPARLHDLRHTYAVDRLNAWIKEGKNVKSYYPYLSEYMGHASYRETDYYLSLVAAFYPEMEKRLAKMNKTILPKVIK